MIALLIGALAAPVPGLQAAVAPSDIDAVFAEAGRPAPVCQDLLPDHARLCFRVVEEGRRRWLAPSDLARLETAPPALRAQVVEQGRGALVPERRHVAGMPPDARSAYLVLRDGQGHVAATLADPTILGALLGGGRFRVAVPRAGVVFAWADPAVAKLSTIAAAELDRILLVAVREAYDTADDAVSPMVHVHEDGRFVPFGQARKREEAPKQP